MFRSVGWAIECTHRLGWAVARLAILQESSNAIIIILVISFRRRLRPLERNAESSQVGAQSGRHFFLESSQVGAQRRRRRRQGMSASPRVLSRRSCVRVVVAVVFSSLYLFSFFIGTWEALFGPASPRPTRDRGRDDDGSQEPSVRTRPTSPPRSSGLDRWFAF